MIIDIDKFVASLIKYYCEAYSVDRTLIRCWFDDVLEEQGLEYKDGKIVKTQRRVAAEAKEALFESEDEKISRTILALIAHCMDSEEVLSKYGSSYAEIKAWLERRGELTQSEVTKISEQVPSILDLKLMDCPLSVRTLNALRLWDKPTKDLTLRDLVGCTKKELLGARNFGNTMLIEVEDFLTGYGLKLKEE